MCGRYVATRSVDELVEDFEIDVVPEDVRAGQWSSYNVAPGSEALVVLERPVDGVPRRQLRPLRWGLVPRWAKDPGTGARMINARAETAWSRPAFREAAAARRALVPADGWYEWTARDEGHEPYYFSPRPAGRGRAGVAMAGLYEFWRSRRGEWLVTFAVMTTEAEPGPDQVHDRMPVVLPDDRWGAWLDPATPAAQAARLVADLPEGRFAWHRV